MIDTNKDIVVLFLVTLYCLIFIPLAIFTDIKYISSISGLSLVIAGCLLVLSKRIKKLNDWYELPIKKKK